MAQNFAIPGALTRLNVATTSLIPNALEALVTQHSGSSAPSSTYPFMVWVDTSTTPATWKMRNAADNGWLILGTLGADARQQLANEGWAGSLSATKTEWIGAAPRACTVKRLVLVSDAASTSSSGNEWQVGLQAYPNATPGSPVSLFSATVGTFTALGGVGGGAEFVADQAYVLVPDQNAELADLDQLELTMTKVGTATTLTRFRAYIEVA